MSESGAPERRRLGLRHLEHFLAVVDEGSIVAAADALFVAASGVSQTVSELERRLGTTLFVRSRTGARATTAGLALIGPARRALTAFRDATENTEMALPTGGHLSVLSLSSLIQEPTSTLVGALVREAPRSRVTLSEPTGAFASDALRPVMTGEVDVAVTEFPEHPPPGLRVVRMPDVQVMLVCPPGTPEPARGTFTVSDLADVGLVIAPLLGSELFHQLQSLDPHVSGYVKVHSQHRDAFMRLAAAGAGAVLLERTRAARAERLGCTVGPLQGLRPRRIAAVSRIDRSFGLLDRFLELCAAGAGDAAEADA